ncbi:MAG: GNAT family N-acetyltransferase [Pseudomonadota bacterium]
MTIAPTITTPRLRLRGHELADFPPLCALFASDRAAYMGGAIPAKESYRWIAAEVGSWVLRGFGSWGVERISDDAFIGQIGINQPLEFPEPELGWVLLEAFEGQGYAAEGAQAALDWWWDASDSDTLVSYIHPDNARSIALANRLGAQHDPDAPLPDGEDSNETVVYRHRRPQ